MSRIANKPVELPSGVEAKINGQMVNVKGPKGSSDITLHESVTVNQEDQALNFAMADKEASNLAMAGTMRSLVANMVQGVSQGFEKKLTLIGVGYRAAVQGKVLNLTLGFSHPVNFEIPEGINIECPSQTEIIVTGIDKQQVGQVAANIRAYRPPEPYKGKGVRYTDEYVIRKEAKKK